MNIRLAKNWRTMLRVASQSRLAPYWAVTAGPNSHSPDPMLVPARTIPGPIRPTQIRHPPAGGGGRWPTSHGGRAPASTFGAGASADSGEGVLMRVRVGGSWMGRADSFRSETVTPRKRIRGRLHRACNV